MSASDPIAPERLEALLRGEAGTDGRERRIGALLDELTLGEISPPAELRERVRSLSAAPAAVAPAPRRLPRCGCAGRAAPRARARPRRRRGVIAGVAITQTRPPDHTVSASQPNLKAADGAGARRPVPAPARRRRVQGVSIPRPSRSPAAQALRHGPRRRRTARCPTGSARRTTRPRCGSRSEPSPISRARRRRCSTPCARSAARRDRRLRHAQRRQRQRA